MKSQRTVIFLLGITLIVAKILIHHLWGLRGAERLSSKDIFYVWEEGKKSLMESIPTRESSENHYATTTNTQLIYH